MGETKPWHDTPNHCVDGKVCGPVIAENNWFKCAACGEPLNKSLTRDEKLRAKRASAAWDAEELRQASEDANNLKRERDLALLREAIARRRKENSRG